MYINESGVWGIEADRALRYGRSYTTRRLFIYLTDIFFMITGISILYSNKTNFGDYFGMMLIFSLMAFLALNIGFQDELFWAYKFVRKYGSCEVKLEKRKMSESDLKTVLSVLSRVRLNDSSGVSGYVALINTMCKRDIVNSRKLMKKLDETISPPTDMSEEVYIYYIEDKKGRRRLALLSTTEEPMYNKLAVGATLGIEEEV